MVMRVAAQWVLVIAVALAYASAESFGEDHGVMEPAAPKMANSLADVADFIQEEVEVEEKQSCDCQPAVTKAYSKFRGDMKKIEALKEQCDVRANKAETEAQKQAGISRRCLAAESMLSADEKTKSKKMREAIAKETSVEAAQYQEKSQELAKQCTEKIALARKDEAAKAGSSVDAAVKKEQMRMKGEVEKFAAQKAEFKLKAKRMQMKLKVELSNVQKEVQDAQEKQMQAETDLKKAQRELKDQKAKLERQAVLHKQKLEAIKAQLAAKSKECESAKKAQVVKLKNSLDKEKEKEKAVEDELRKDKAKLGKEEVELNAALRKDQRLEAANNAEKQNTAIMKDKLKDEKAQAKADREKARAEEKKAQDETNKAKEELAGAKAKAVATEAKDAIAEGQTKGQLTVVLGKLKANQATIDELKKKAQDETNKA